MTDPTDPIAILSVSPIRRLFSTGVQAGLGVVLILTAGQLPDPSPLALVTLLALGGAALWMAWNMYHATSRDVILTREAVTDSQGETIARLDDIRSVDSGFFAFKPSNGFLLRLSSKHSRRWVPGLWWRMGTRVGIGGATNGKAARDMADIIRLIKADPSAGLPPEG